MQSVPALAEQAQESATVAFPASGSRVILLSLLGLAAGIGAAFWLNQARFERFSGYLQARLQTITAGREARVARILVAPGAAVTAGQPIVTLEDRELEQRLEGRKQEVEGLEIELARTSAALEVELDIQRRDVLDRIFETKWRSAQLIRQQSFAPGELLLSGRIGRGLRNDPPLQLTFAVVPPSILGETPQSEPEPANHPLFAELRLCADHIAELEKMNRDLPAKISRSMGIDLVQSRLDHARTALAALERQHKELTVVAQTAGMVGVFHKQVGEHVTPDEPIVQLLDEEQPFLMLHVPSPRISDFAPGTVVELRFPGGHRGKGRVEAIPPQTSDLSTETGAPKETVITAQIDPVGKLWPELPFGSVVEVRRRR